VINFCSQERPQKLHNSTTGCCYLLQTKAKVMMMQYTNCVVKAHKVHTVKLTLYKFRSWWHVLCEI